MSRRVDVVIRIQEDADSTAPPRQYAAVYVSRRAHDRCAHAKVDDLLFHLGDGICVMFGAFDGGEACGFE